MAATCLLGPGITSAFAAVTPGWECIPTGAGVAVVSGGTGAAPSCGAGTTAVLAPTFVSSGVGGKPTVEFSSVNLQVVSGSESTSGTLNGEGNLIVGYAENPHNYSRTGSNDLIVGSAGGWTGYGEIVGGFSNQVSGDYAAAFGAANVTKGIASLAAGHSNTASGGDASVTGGLSNTAAKNYSSVTGGQSNQANDLYASVSGGCDNLAGPGTVPKRSL